MPMSSVLPRLPATLAPTTLQARWVTRVGRDPAKGKLFVYRTSQCDDWRGMGGCHGQAALSVGYSRQLQSRASLTSGAAVSGNETTGGVGVGIGW
ncbi:YadA-like family protein [Rhodanobacter umsongensis]|uniref:YadA-like family protein n=1 Tax=Rhodanobacter umsongensis TaxID=633153 RepID=A0ABW0JJN0_9GAMM